MIIVMAAQTVKAGKKQDVLALAQPLMAATRKEAGCVSYTLFDDPGDPQRLVFVEEWLSKEALKQHLATPHIAEWREKVKDLRAAPTVIKLYEGQETTL
jgi:quinol monooxygenase YgiN